MGNTTTSDPLATNDGEVDEKKAKKNNGKKSKPEKASRVPMPYMQNRELSWLTFNLRVLDQGADARVPLLQKLTFVSIFASNLMEFFMVRVGSLTDLSLVKKEILDSKTLMTPAEQLDAIYARCHELYPEEERIYRSIQNELAMHGIRQLDVEDLSDEQEEFLRKHLDIAVKPYLSPQIINARHPFPHLENGSLYVLVRLDEEGPRVQAEPELGKNGKAKKNKNVGADDATFGLIPIPHQSSRVIPLPGEGWQFILLENALKLIVDDVFSMYRTKRAQIIRVTRNADIDPNVGIPDIDFDYREHMKRILKRRARLTPVRLESDQPLSPATERFLLKRLSLKPHQVFVTKVPLDMEYAWGLPDMIGPEYSEGLTPESFTPSWPACLDEKRPIMEQVMERDILLQYPYESMDPFVRLLREAADDPDVISIKITLYRLASQSHLAEALLSAADKGKEVTALFELRARFDEFNNIEWSQRFEEAGANVIYGFHELKVHSKICTITRHTDKGLQHITQLGTGNYNEKTAKLYTDFSFMTTDEEIGKDAAEFFRNMNLENASDSYTTLSVAPLQIKPMILEKIDEQIALSAEGKPNGLFFKTNSVTDKDIIEKIVEASQAGVSTTLFVRGISCIVPGVEGYTDNVRVVSIVGRLLEHSRIYAFGAMEPENENFELYLASADLMTRNMDKRIEIAWPIRSAELRNQVIDYIKTSLDDTAKLRELQPSLRYTPLGYFVQDGEEVFDSQDYLIDKAAEENKAAVEEREREAARRSSMARAQRIKDEQARLIQTTESGLKPVTLPGEEPAAAPEPIAVPEPAAAPEPVAAPEPAEPVAAAVPPVAIPLEELEAVAEAPAEAAAEVAEEAAAEVPAPDAEPAAEAPAKPEVEAEAAPEAEPAAEAPAEVEAAPAQAPVEPEPAPAPAPEPERVTPVIIEDETEPAQPEMQVQLIMPKKPTFWQRLKFLFTGHF